MDLKNTHKRLLVCVGLSITLVIVICTLASIIPVNPEGLYRVDQIAIAGKTFYEFKDNAVSLVLFDEGSNAYRKIEHIGTYTNNNGQWIFLPKDHSPNMVIRATCFSIRISENGGSPIVTYPRKMELR